MIRDISGLGEDDADHGLVTLGRGAVEHGQPVLVPVQEARPSGQETLHQLLVTLLHCAPQGCGPVLALGIHILPHLYQQLSHVPQPGDGGVVQGAVAKLVSL